MAKTSIADAIAKTLGDVSKIDTPVQYIPLNQLKPNPRNFYPAPDPDALTDLAASIAANGLLEPLTVVKNGVMPEYRIISGHSRWRAMQSLEVRNKRPDLVKAVPCLVLDIAPSYDEEMCLIIEANRQRVKGAALLAMEAEKLTEAYTRRKEAGEDLPGRIRDRVAQALQVSATKLAMAQATQKNLVVPSFRQMWKDGQISDSVAYEISKMEGDHQYRLLDYLCDNHREAGSLTVNEVKALEKTFAERPRKFDMPKEKEDELFLKATERLLLGRLDADLSRCSSRAEIITELRKCNRHRGCGGPDYDVTCSNEGVAVQNGRPGNAPVIKRSWAEVYEALCVIALRKTMG